jgi:predicted HicB family RNase H-like nuclease
VKHSTEERVLLRIRVAPALDEALTAAAAERGVSVNWLVNNALDDFLSRLLPPDKIRLTHD